MIVATDPYALVSFRFPSHPAGARYGRRCKQLAPQFACCTQSLIGGGRPISAKVDDVSLFPKVQDERRASRRPRQQEQRFIFSSSRVPKRSGCRFLQFVDHAWFDGVVALVIVMNLLLICMEPLKGLQKDFHAVRIVWMAGESQ